VFGAVLASQRASAGLFFDVLAGAIDAHLHPQVQSSNSKPIIQDTTGGDTMTFAMLQRCAAGGPKLSPSDRRIASRLAISSSLVMAILYVVLTKIYREAPAVQAIFWASAISPTFIYRQTAYLRARSWLTRGFILWAGISVTYVFMLAVCMVAARL
jgi:hypothetical protein